MVSRVYPRGRSPQNYLSIYTGQVQTSNSLYTYDNRGRLASEQQSFLLNGVTQASKTGTYSYDLANNLMGGTGGWTYNSNNQLTAAPAQGGLPGGTGFAYDNAGNLTSMNGTGLGYDCWGNLTSAGNVSYGYDSDGNQISRTSGGVTTYNLYDGLGSGLIAVLDNNGNVLSSVTWGDQGIISDNVGGVNRLYADDGQGNTRALINANDGSVIGEKMESAFGDWQPTVSGVMDTPYGWQGSNGAYQDTNNGMAFVGGGEPYIPNTGRFAMPAGAGYSGGVSPYGYGGGDPVNLGGGYRGGDQDDEDDFPVDEAGHARPYQPVLRGINHGARLAKGLLNAAANFNPICNLISGITGQDASGKQLSPLQRGLALASVVAPFVKVPKINLLKGTKLGSAITKSIDSLPPLRFLHSESLLRSGSGYKYWLNKPTDEIVASLLPNAKSPLRAYENGVIAEGNTRVRILMDRGYDVHGLPRLLQRKSFYDPLP